MPAPRLILSRVDGRPQPAWKHVTISKGSILYVISEALGQLKWVWFAQRTRPLSNLREFDWASRGFYGSGELMWRLRFRHFAVWGAMAMILALAFDPFAQNLIHYYQNMVVDPSQRALLTKTTSYNTTGLSLMERLKWLDPTLKANVYNSLFSNDGSRPWATPHQVCSSGNCTWDPIAALEARALCSEVTEHLNTSCSVLTEGSFNGTLNCTATLPMTATVDWFVENEKYGQPFSVAVDGFGLDTNLTKDSRWRAMECSILPVVHNFRASSWAEWDENMPARIQNTYLQPPWGPEQGMQVNQTFVLGGLPINGLNTFFDHFFVGAMYMGSWSHVTFTSGSSGIYAAKDFIQAMAVIDMTRCKTKSAEKLQCAMENVAAAMSKSFRDPQYIAADSDSNRAQMANGRATSSVTYVSVRWQWIALPILVWLLGTPAISGPKWKNDPIPLLFLYQDEKNQGHGADVSAQDSWERAKNLKIRLYKSDDKMILGG
ncbi:hypothetical protein BDV25DRAFT_127495 [Aspergillus avenaceus]|uniref:Uncharacterized protein n=1 Tax=Aspergillus avenaceus TaxID=36643 RepID=A0A5N6U426_ASPAV|nr:hypothetical protein BDV25DRAFT_127495 [Aspergillus avenaceus]